MNKDVPQSLKFWFIVHFIVDIIFALPLLIAPILEGDPPAKWLFLGIFVSFSGLWIYYKVRLHE